jgi:hypothetical protein
MRVGGLMLASLVGIVSAAVSRAAAFETSPHQAAGTAACEVTAPPGALPFGAGERLDYSIGGKVMGVPAWLAGVSGTATMEVLGIETIRQRPAYHVTFGVKGRALAVFTVDDRYDSWIDTRAMTSLRFHEVIRNSTYKANRKYEIFPERREFQRDTNPPERSVEHPLDEGSFLYFLRTVALEVGKPCSFPYYFKPDRNPVTVEVVKRERIEAAGKSWNALLIRPTILTTERGFFSKDSEAQIWLSDDADRIILRIKSRFATGTYLNLELKSHRRPPGRAPSP